MKPTILSRAVLAAIAFVWRPFDAVGFARFLGVRVGSRCRIGRRVSFGSEPYLITIGDHVSISNGTEFITHDGGVWVFRDEHPTVAAFAPINVGDNTFIGARVVVLPGVTIGRDCVVGAASVVTRSIPDGSVAVGTPARVISTTAQYKERVLPKCLPLHGSCPKRLRVTLLSHFSLNPSDQTRAPR